MLVRFGTNLGTRDAQKLGLDFSKCTKDGDPVDLSEEKVAEVRKLCGDASVVAVEKKAAFEKAKAADDKK